MGSAAREFLPRKEIVIARNEVTKQSPGPSLPSLLSSFGIAEAGLLQYNRRIAVY
jgi:hypothetical protein